ncbi:putative class V chitinase [Plectosphaerella plurivora]|uniref:chitinase n=1 Tax=Plectosphaerella plurivora TaxID=936078 RepID=A0A9P8VL58_9PEZI|nr:putative class V chitinase [Plectosphaerella plurivora]
MPSRQSGPRASFSLRSVIFPLALLLLLFASLAQAQQCSRTNLCATGCCSQHGFCGETSEHCGTGCLSTCDWKPPQTQCSRTRLCETGCCSQHGFCGESSGHCGSGCLSTCDWKPPVTDCSATKLCEIGCCSSSGFCGTTSAHCGTGCQSTCDYKPPETECNANKPCEQGCCSKHGFCGYGADFCSSENCVNNCDSRADCDPGTFGKDWVKWEKCPLNVCCSEHGFCGMTPEFCGKNQPKRPTCEVKNQPLNRVVGYYEGWATGRPCNAFYPEQIPRGAYTHLFFAFATIDPVTLEIQPAAREDIEMYKRLNALKMADPNLRTFIAVGGWAFSDPGPTRTTFSDMARSTASIDKFARSVIRFLQQYDFDGIDIDWEYPVADDRGGRGEDYENIVTFARRMKNALKTTKRNGFTITIPASYWYLQHFDIKGLEPHVDWFNIMSYDLHGTWDMENQWTGPWLNAHTNLTELKDSMDLYWRNGISSDKIVFGTGFYGRAFTVADPSCITPGCRYISGAPRQPCSREVSVMLNNEIMDVIRETGSKPVLHEKEAVKTLTWGNNWVAYDDEETLAMRADFARSQCLGGIMVWAVSHDTRDGRFSRAIMNAAKRVPALGSSTDGYDEHTVVHDQCRWTNCGEGCPSDWHYVRRSDSGAGRDEVMANHQGCEGYGSRYLCCPPTAAGWDGPRCGWYGHRNGNCDHTSHADPVFEIGSNNMHCKRKNAYQMAGCTWSSEAVQAHQSCYWSYEFPGCNGGSCSGSDDEFFSSSTGSGGAFCNGDQRRKYCCRDNRKEYHWENCEWSENAGRLPSGLRSGTCLGGCPSGKTPLSLDHSGGGCSRGARARCCDTGYKTVKKRYNDDDAEFDFYLDLFLTEGDGYCVADSDEDERLWYAQLYLENALASIIYGTADVSTVDVWRERVGLRYAYLSIANIRTWSVTNSVGTRLGRTKLPKRILCALKTFNNLIGGSEGPKCTCNGDDCCVSKLCERDNARRKRQNDIQPLRNISAHRIGNVPLQSNMWQRAIGYSSEGCWDYDVELQAGRSRANRAGLIVEHVLELQTLAMFIRATITGQLRSGQTFEDTVNPQIWEDLLFTPYPANIPPVNGYTTPHDRMWHAFGHKGNTAPLVLADEDLNQVKRRIWSYRDETAIRSDDAMNRAIQPRDNAAFTAFVNEVRHPLAALMFINDPMVREGARGAYRRLRSEMQILSRRARELDPVRYRNPDLHNMLDRFMRDHIVTITRDVREFVARWRTIGRNAIIGSGVQDERELLEGLDAIRDGVADFEYNFDDWFGD